MHTGLFPWYQAPTSLDLGTRYANNWIETDLVSFARNTKTSKDILNYEDIDVPAWHEMSIGLLRRKEKQSDISGIADFIEENLKTKSLFWTPNHPRGNIAHLLCSKVFQHLGLPKIPETFTKTLDGVLSPERCPILPCVKRGLGLRRNDDIAFFMDQVPLTARQYVERYISVRNALVPDVSRGIADVKRYVHSDYGLTALEADGAPA